MNKYKTVPSGTLRFVIRTSELTWKKDHEHYKFVEPYVVLHYGDREIKGLYDHSYESKDKSAGAKPAKELKESEYSMNQNFKFNTAPDKTHFFLEYYTLPHDDVTSNLQKHFLVARHEVDMI